MGTLFRDTVVCLLGLAGLAMAACQSSREVVASQVVRADTLVLVLEDAKSPQVGTLRLTDSAEGVRWTMTDTATEGKGYGELRSGLIAGVSVQDFADDFGEAWTSGVAEAATRFRATLCCLSGGQLQAQRVVATDSQDLVSSAIPTTDRFTAMWQDATAIPKGIWYKYLGPVEPGEGITLDFSVDAWRISKAFSDGLDTENTDFDD